MLNQYDVNYVVNGVFVGRFMDQFPPQEEKMMMADQSVMEFFQCSLSFDIETVAEKHART